MLLQRLEGFYSLTQNKCVDEEFWLSSLHACSSSKTQSIEARDNKALVLLLVLVFLGGQQWQMSIILSVQFPINQ